MMLKGCGDIRNNSSLFATCVASNFDSTKMEKTASDQQTQKAQQLSSEMAQSTNFQTQRRYVLHRRKLNLDLAYIPLVLTHFLHISHPVR